MTTSCSFSSTKYQLAMIYYTALTRPNKAETVIIVVCYCILSVLPSSKMPSMILCTKSCVVYMEQAVG